MWGIANKVKLLYTMLTLPSWASLNLTVNFFSTKYQNLASGCPPLPKQMKTRICSMDDLACYNDDYVLDVEGECYEDAWKNQSMKCPRTQRILLAIRAVQKKV